jgi:hypothetical protein
MNTNDNNNSGNKSDLSRQQPNQGGTQQGRDKQGKQASAPGKDQGEAANETRKAGSMDSEKK